VVLAQRELDQLKERKASRAVISAAEARVGAGYVELGNEHRAAVSDGTGEAYIQGEQHRGGAIAANHLDQMMHLNQTGHSEKGAASKPDKETLERPAWAEKVLQVQWWYYKDTHGVPQGPHYPGQMRGWYTGGYFKSTLEVAPSFQGEVPQDYTPIFMVFEEPIDETAFIPGPGIANFAPTVDEPIEQKGEISRDALIKSIMGHVSQGENEKSKHF